MVTIYAMYIHQKLQSYHIIIYTMNDCYGQNKWKMTEFENILIKRSKTLVDKKALCLKKIMDTDVNSSQLYYHFGSFRQYAIRYMLYATQYARGVTCASARITFERFST